jgi:hypothetical protein
MSGNTVPPCTLLQMRFKLRVPPQAILGNSIEAAATIVSIEGLIWKIWISREEDLQMGGVYLFANRKSAEAYIDHPVISALRSNPFVESSQAELWDVEHSLSAITRAPLPGVSMLFSQSSTVLAGGL